MTDIHTQTNIQTGHRQWPIITWARRKWAELQRQSWWWPKHGGGCDQI